jgi:hypothetical protein
VLGPDINLEWFRLCVRESGAKPIPGFNVQSIDGLVARFVSDDWQVWSGVEIPRSLKLLILGSKLAIVGLTLLVMWRAGRPRSEGQFNSELCIAIVLALLLSPISWTHYYCLLLLPIALAMGGKLSLPRNASIVIAMTLATMLISLPVIRPRGFMVADELREAIFLSLHFYGAIILLGVLLAGIGVPHSGQRSALARRS